MSDLGKMLSHQKCNTYVSWVLSLEEACKIEKNEKQVCIMSNITEILLFIN